MQKPPRALNCVLLLIAILPVFAQTPQAANPRPITRNGIAFTWKSIRLTAKDDPADARPDMHEATPGYGTLTAFWPQAGSETAASKASEWAAWNEGIEAATLRMSQAGMGTPNPAAGKWTAQPGVDNDVTVALGLVSDPLVTATVSYLWDGHGAHPNHGSIEFNWLLDKQRQLQPEDVFTPGSDWAGALETRTNAYLHKQLDQDGKSYEDFEQPGEMQKVLHKIISDPENWRLDGSGLSIVFQPYAVACYACTPPPFTIPWAELKPILAPGFAIPAASIGSSNEERDRFGSGR